MILLFLADGFEETEALESWDILLRARHEVKLVSVSSSKEVRGTHGLKVSADLLLSDLPDSLIPEAVVLPGGMPGAENLYASSGVRNLIEKTNENGGLICAICASPSVFGRMGLLKGKKATCFPSFEKYLTGAETIDEDVVTDGNVITGRAMGCTGKFALAVVKALDGEKKANDVRESAFL